MTGRIRINDDYYVTRLRGRMATIVAHPYNSIVIAKVDDFAPMGHGNERGEWAFVPQDFEAST